MRILLVPDTMNWAIGRLVQVLKKYNTQHQIEIVAVHPKEVAEGYADLKTKVDSFKPDLIQYDYFRSAGQLLEIDPGLARIPSIVVHHNQRRLALHQYDFFKLGIKHIVVHNPKAVKLLAEKGWVKNVSQIPLAIDPHQWEYSDVEPIAWELAEGNLKKFTVGYAGRVVEWKRLDLIAEAVKDMPDVQINIMGKVENPSYFAKINQKQIKTQFLNVKDDERIAFYRSLNCFVMASDDDGRESGPLPLLEAMACGVPVITTTTGIAAEIAEDGVNCLVVPHNDAGAIKNAIARLKEDKVLRATLRQKAWETIKNMTEEKRALQFSKLWYQVKNPDFTLASIIIPTFNRAKEMEKMLDYFGTQEDYPNFELVIVDDNSTDNTAEVVQNGKTKYNLNIKYINTKKDGYNLAMARNLGIIASEGDVLIFCDSRMLPQQGSVLAFVEAVENAGRLMMGGNTKVWFFGDKGSHKKSFVENFSAVKRDEIINFGMFNERITHYGGMSQELRSRWMKQGGEFYYVETAKATEMISSKMTTAKRNEVVDMKLLLYKLYGDQRY